MASNKDNQFQNYQDAQNQLLQIQQQQQQNLMEARLAAQAQAANNNTLSQAAQVAAQTVAMNNSVPQTASFNPATMATLQQYGLGQPRMMSNQSRSQQVTKQNITINNNTRNITNNNVSVPANIGGPLQGRPLQINPEAQMGGFKTWLSNVFAQQNAEAARRDREYERRQSALERESNKVMKRLGEIGSGIGKALDPRRLTSNSTNTLKTLFTVLGIGKLVKYSEEIAVKLDNFFNDLGITGKGKNSETGQTFFDRVEKRLVGLFGGKENEHFSVALRKFFWNEDAEDGWGIFNSLFERIKLEVNTRLRMAGESLDAFKINSDGTESEDFLGIQKMVTKVVNSLGAAIKALATGDMTSVVEEGNKAAVDKNSKNKSSNLSYDQINKEGQEKIITNANGYVLDENKKLVETEGKLNIDKDNNLTTTIWNSEGNVGFANQTVNLKNVRNNNISAVTGNMASGNLKTGGRAVYYNSDIHLDSNGKLRDEPIIALLVSLDIVQLIINIEASDKSVSEKDFTKVTQLLKKLQELLRKEKDKYIPVCNQWTQIFPKKYSSKYYKVVLKAAYEKRGVHIQEGNGTVWGNAKANFNNLGQINKNIEEDASMYNLWKPFVDLAYLLTPGSSSYIYEELGPDDILAEFALVETTAKDTTGLYGTVFPCYVITEKDLVEVLNSYMNRGEGESILDTDDKDFSYNMMKAMYNKSSMKSPTFSEAYETAIDPYKKRMELDEQHQQGKAEWNENFSNSRLNQAVNNIKSTPFVGWVTENATSLGKSASDLFKNTKKKSEFIQTMREPLLKVLKEKGISEDYADILLSQLAFESGWGKHEAGQYNFGGIKAPKDGNKPLDPEHAAEFWTHETLDSGDLSKYPKLEGRVAEGYPMLGNNGKWDWKIRDWFKTYDTLEDFFSDYVDKLQKNWESSLSLEEINPENYAYELKNHGKYGSYFTADLDKYTNSIRNIYDNILKIREDIDNNKEEITSTGNNNTVPNMGSQDENDERGGDPGLSFDIDKAVDTIRNNTTKLLGNKYGEVISDREDNKKNKSIGRCARYVREAINAGGIKGSFGDAHEFIDKLPKYGFQEILSDSPNEPGDISVEDSTEPHKYGHVAMWDGTKWISDFPQKGRLIHKDGINGKLHKFRHTNRISSDNLVSNELVSTLITKPTTTITDFKPKFKNMGEVYVDRFLNNFMKNREKEYPQDVAFKEEKGGEKNNEENQQIIELLTKLINVEMTNAGYTAAVANETKTNTEVMVSLGGKTPRSSTSTMMTSGNVNNYGG